MMTATRSETVYKVTAFFAIFGCVASHARAHEFYAVRVPNPVTVANSIGTVRPCITCHNNPDGGSGCIGTGGTAPCLNPFGIAFGSNMFNWNSMLALLDSDGDGFTNGQELQDPSGTWEPGDHDPGIPSYHTRPGFPEQSPGLFDADSDRYCYFGRDLNMNGVCSDPGENNGSLDCDDTMAGVHSGATEVCSNTADDDCNGKDTLHDDMCTGVTDRDGDHYCPMGHDLNNDRDCIDNGENGNPVDCDDTRITVYPAAPENCIDTFDNDCDGAIDLADTSCNGNEDVDDDGYCPVGRDINNDGDCIDPGEITAGADCDDHNADANPSRAEICSDAIDNDCDGNANLTDSDCRSVVDEDRDGHCPQGADRNGDRDCADVDEGSGPSDCNDSDGSISPSTPENCTNDKDDDCDGTISLADSNCAGYIDTDGDRYCYVGFDQDRNGSCTAENEVGMNTDCDEGSSLVNPAAVESCTDGVDNDCDGSLDAYDPVCLMDYLDFDHDRWCAVGEDKSADGDCSDAGEQAGPADAAPRDATIHPGAHENCLDRKDNDQDGTTDSVDTDCTRAHDTDEDGWCPLGKDTNGDGDCEDNKENIGASDCNDTEEDVRPDAQEDCFDFADNDCDGDVDLLDSGCFHLLDRDRDGFCGMGIDDTADGDCLDEGEQRLGADCDDQSRMIGPRAVEACTNSKDDDCDGKVDLADTQCLCMTTTNCDDSNACTLDRCTGDMQECEHVPDPTCGADAGPNGSKGSSKGCHVGGRNDLSLPWLLIMLVIAAVAVKRGRKRRES